MDHAYYLDFLWNAHEWYKIDNSSDFVRAILWCTANIVTGICYLLIPYELLLWRRELKSTAAVITAFGFVAFITFCGLHHFVDVMVMPTAPWWAILLVNIPMAVASVLTAYYINRNRQLIVDVLRLLNGNAEREFNTLYEKLEKMRQGLETGGDW